MEGCVFCSILSYGTVRYQIPRVINTVRRQRDSSAMPASAQLAFGKGALPRPPFFKIFLRQCLGYESVMLWAIYEREVRKKTAEKLREDKNLILHSCFSLILLQLISKANRQHNTPQWWIIRREQEIIENQVTWRWRSVERILKFNVIGTKIMWTYIHTTYRYYNVQYGLDHPFVGGPSMPWANEATARSSLWSQWVMMNASVFEFSAECVHLLVLYWYW